ncbi:aromatic ring-cleaving dioxygenase [Bradyrhizobium ontarionense]|uniref:Aromatic ring-cleaving dioxygenase n=1 Tax=Bradyrhizobium ontarionense TaxID=2898149 RepID=A0ABY3RC39_9BRAD|nr:DOPA 4,5-dioxygenase family protein [Bradyrhizobium sp. A19]UFZ04759.1 aromatic ring-cleaving dioxygenase [Bradyrhizobium sp. A19]
MPQQLSTIASFHAHIYYDEETRAEAEQLRRWIAERFVVTLGRWHDALVGPHERSMYQVAFAVEVFPALVPWLMLNHGRLSVLVHPNTTQPLADHTAHALWIGPPLGIREEKLPEQSEAELPREPNTAPSHPA